MISFKLNLICKKKKIALFLSSTIITIFLNYKKYFFGHIKLNYLIFKFPKQFNLMSFSRILIHIAKESLEIEIIKQVLAENENFLPN